MAKRIALLTALLSLVVTSLAFAGGSRDYGWQLTPTGSPARLRGLSAVSERIAWTSGSLGTVLRTTNKGATWQSVGPPGTENLQFRDIEAFDADTALILSIGNGPDSRIYRTTNAGRSWSLVFVNDEPQAFYDCMAFFDKHRGLALSDPVNGRFRILATNDGGRSWHVVDADMPPALPAEFAFA
ncbi:MAG: oxidoreductase, partial [Actinomycetota bacterium]|nr:oxidoreductase [Actinomycetota bacterium]